LVCKPLAVSCPKHLLVCKPVSSASEYRWRLRVMIPELAPDSSSHCDDDFKLACFGVRATQRFNPAFKFKIAGQLQAAITPKKPNPPFSSKESRVGDRNVLVCSGRQPELGPKPQFREKSAPSTRRRRPPVPPWPPPASAATRGLG
jgi:hypothetical protein